MTELPVRDVSRYYERNTARFLRFGGGGEEAAIHRQIWEQGVRDEREAFRYLNRLVLQEISPAIAGEDRHVLDLGCGVGGTASWIARHSTARVSGIANCTEQIRIAAERAARDGLSSRCSFWHADYLWLPEIPAAHAVVAIESFAHASDASRFFDSVSSHLVEGGRLVICDDYIADDCIADDCIADDFSADHLSESEEIRKNKRAQKWLSRFSKGWHLHSLMSVHKIEKLASQAGFKLLRKIDLTANIRVYPAMVLAGMLILSALPFRNAALENWRGGSALQVCLKNGWSRYFAMTWEKGG